MPNLYCSQCGKYFYLTQKDYNKTIKDLDNFCSTKCLVDYIKSYVPKRVDVHYWVTRPMLVGDLIYSPKSDRYFRSKYESLIWDLFELEGIEAEYETYCVREGRKSYTPDFYIKDKDLFVEVKGLWKGGAKAKVRQWANKINLVLIPWYLYRDISKYVKQKRG